MKKPSKRTRKRSETSKLLATINKLAEELAIQAKASRVFAEKVLILAQEKDAQIKLVLESKFQEYVQVVPPRPQPQEFHDDPQQLSDISEMSEDSAESEVVKATARERDAGKALADELAREFTELAAEHAKTHGQEVQA